MTQSPLPFGFQAIPIRGLLTFEMLLRSAFLPGFSTPFAIRSVTVEGARVEVHLRLPTSFCAPNFAWLMASDAHDAVAAVPGVERVVVELDDHHDSDLVNRGRAAGGASRGAGASDSRGGS